MVNSRKEQLYYWRLFCRLLSGVSGKPIYQVDHFQFHSSIENLLIVQHHGVLQTANKRAILHIF